jgi:CRP/FNR family transcriptional regulator
MPKQPYSTSNGNNGVHCCDCRIQKLCIPKSLNEKEMAKLDEIIERSSPTQKGESLFKTKDSLTALYAIRSGSVKSYKLSAEGAEQITAFHFSGEVLGLDAISIGHHTSFSTALETSMICKIPYNALTELAQRCPSLHKKLLRMLSCEIRNVQNIVLLHANKNSEQRLAHFIYSLSEEYALRGFSSSEFKLSMSRTDIASFLGLTVETISRLLSRFQKQGLISVTAKYVKILNMQEIINLAAPS